MTNLLQSIFTLCIFVLSLTVAEEVIYAQMGDTVQIELVQHAKKYIYWYFGGQEIAWLNPLGGAKITDKWKNRLTLSYEMLKIQNVTQEIFGTFSCEVKENLKVIATERFQVIKLNVAVNSPILLPGELLSLTCSVENPSYRPQIYWLRPPGNKTEGKGGKLTVQATHLDSGQWTCVVSNKKETRAKVDVAVIDLLPTAPIHTQYSSKSSPLSIPCSLPPYITWDQVKAKGVQEVGWYFCPNPASNLICNKSSLFSLSLGDKPTWKAVKAGTLQPARNPSNGDLSLGAKLGREAGRGDYECFMKFQNGVILNRAVHVELLQINASPGKELTYGQRVNLTCTTGGPLPSDLRVKWVPPKDASHYSHQHDHQSTQLTIPEVGRGDKGTWRCELWRGDTLLTSAVVALNIEPKISAWLVVTICSATVILILLMILVFMLHRRRQRRIRRVRLRHRLCHCKNPKPKGFYRS